MDDLKCPKCGQNHLHLHTKLVNGSDGTFADIRYEWECGWCAHTEGDYTSTIEAKKDYDEKYGGNE